MNITESNDLNTVLQHLIPGTPARSGGRPDSDQAQAAAARLADKAKKVLVAGINGADVQAAWSTADSTGAAGPLEVPVEELAPHPDNVRHDIGDVTELALSIQARGVLSPLTVATMDAWIEANPALADQVEIGSYVVIAGHRRLKAANQAELETVPVIVRDDLAGEAPTVGTMLDENLHREGLSVLEEARALERLRNAHSPRLTERQLATLRHVSPSHVHKRLSLLKLPDRVAAAVEEGSLTVTDALILLELPKDEIAEAYAEIGPGSWQCARAVVDRRKGRREEAAAREEARAALAKAGIQVVASAQDVLGRDAHLHHLHDVTLEQITNPDDTIAVLGQGGRTWLYSRTIPIEHAEPDTPGAASPGSSERDDEDDPQEVQREADKKAAEEAAAYRAAACEWLINADPPDPAVVAEILADYMLIDGGIEYYELIRKAAEWCCKPIDLPEGANWQAIGEAEEAWIDEQAAAGGTTALRASLAIALADLEKSLPAAWTWDGKPGVWSPRDIRHVRRLVEHAEHELCEIEQRVIAHSEAKHAAEAAEAEQDGDDDDD